MDYELYAGEYEFETKQVKEHVLEQVELISRLKLKNKTLQQAESSRKMIFAIIDDIRVLLIKLAERLDLLRRESADGNEHARETAQDVLAIWAPMAGRLGISSIKDELEDLSLKCTNPDVYEQLKKIVALKKGERSEFLGQVEKSLYRSAEKAGITISVQSRAKHFYSIYQKMRKRNKSADELFDLLAIRILCNTNYDCYTLLGLVHTLYKPVDGRFKDYIAMPKPNGYQSLHTTVIADKSPLEIQIRTFDMHLVAEQGAASHWLYKKGNKNKPITEQTIEAANRLKKIPLHIGDNSFFIRIKEEILGKDIFVFTPKHEVIHLPDGATAIDFAYAIHSAVGEHIVAAKADGHIIQLATPLKTTQTVEILTNPQAHPTVNQLALVKTVRARSKIRSWLSTHEPTFAHQEPTQTTRPAQEATANQAAQNTKHPRTQQETTAAKGTVKPLSTKIRIGNTTNFLISFGRCCSPVHGDSIVGYVSRGRGIIIHKDNCSNVWRIPNIESRILEVEWDEPPKK